MSSASSPGDRGAERGVRGAGAGHRASSRPIFRVVPTMRNDRRDRRPALVARRTASGAHAAGHRLKAHLAGSAPLKAHFRVVPTKRNDPRDQRPSRPTSRGIGAPHGPRRGDRRPTRPTSRGSAPHKAHLAGLGAPQGPPRGARRPSRPTFGSFQPSGTTARIRTRPHTGPTHAWPDATPRLLSAPTAHRRNDRPPPPRSPAAATLIAMMSLGWNYPETASWRAAPAAPCVRPRLPRSASAHACRAAATPG